MNNDVIRCSKCNNEILIKNGPVYFAGTWFNSYSCEKCGNLLLLESENQEKTIKINKNDIKLLVFD